MIHKFYILQKLSFCLHLLLIFLIERLAGASMKTLQHNSTSQKFFFLGTVDQASKSYVLTNDLLHDQEVKFPRAHIVYSPGTF